MIFEDRERTVVVGIGSLIHSDDGAGLRALRRLEKDPRLPRDVEIIDGSLLGLDTISRIQSASRLLFLDAVDVGARPGTVLRLRGVELTGLPSGTSAHDIGVSGLISLLEFLGRTPEDIVLIGIQPGTTELGVWLSSDVEANLDLMVTESLRQLSEWLEPVGQAEREAERSS